MKYGFSLIMRGAESTRNSFEQMALKAEQWELDSLWASDHIIIPELKTSKYPGRANGQFPPFWLEGYWEPFTALSYVAAITKKITLGTSVLIMPMRNPIEVARNVADLDQLAEGRFILGVGVGWFREEFDVLDWPFNQRGARTNEGLELCKALWTQERPSFAGKFYNFENVYFGPKPVSQPHPPIWIGGKSEAAYKRVAKFADAWHPNRPTFEGLAKDLADLKVQVETAGRKMEDITIGVKSMLTFQDGAPAEGQVPTEGTPEMIISSIKRYQEMGATHFTFDVNPESLEHALYTMERFVNEIRPKL